MRRPIISCTVGGESCIARAMLAPVIGSPASSIQNMISRYSCSATVAVSADKALLFGLVGGSPILVGMETRIAMLNVGWMTAAVGIWRQGEPAPERPVRLPVPAYLIETERERILVDTGLHPAAAADSEAHYGPGPIAFFALEQE